MVTGTPCTCTPLMLMVCTAWAAAASCAAFRLRMPPAGAILGSGRSLRGAGLRPGPSPGLRDTGLPHDGADEEEEDEGGGGSTGKDEASCSTTVCRSPEGVLK